MSQSFGTLVCNELAKLGIQAFVRENLADLEGVVTDNGTRIWSIINSGESPAVIAGQIAHERKSPARTDL